MYGGTGSMSKSRDMPDDLPDRLEAGTANVCGIAGLKAGIDFIRKTGTDRIGRRERVLADILSDGLGRMKELDVLLPDRSEHTGVISAVPRDLSCEELAARLGKCGVAVRAGLHCAPLAHASAGTDGTGTVRYSVSFFNTREEMERALEITEKCLKNNYKM